MEDILYPSYDIIEIQLHFIDVRVKSMLLHIHPTSVLHATRYAEGGAESSEYCDEKLDDVLPNVFVDSHSGINLMYN